MSRVVHFEILADDPEKVAEFYKEALGWEVMTWDGPQAYWMVTTGDEKSPGINGAIMGKHFEQSVINTVQVESLEDAAAQIERCGGERVTEANEIPEAGIHSYFKDPAGTLFGVLQPKEGA